MKHKVLACMTRPRNGQTQLLVSDHREYPEAGTQIPAGTVENGEPVEAALFREVHEESGLANMRLARKLAEYESREWGAIRHVFHLTAPDPRHPRSKNSATNCTACSASAYRANINFGLPVIIFDTFTPSRAKHSTGFPVIKAYAIS